MGRVRNKYLPCHAEVLLAQGRQAADGQARSREGVAPNAKLVHAQCHAQRSHFVLRAVRVEEEGAVTGRRGGGWGGRQKLAGGRVLDIHAWP